MKVKDRIKKLVRVKASELVPNPKNWRMHPEKQQNAMKGVLAEIEIKNDAVNEMLKEIVGAAGVVTGDIPESNKEIDENEMENTEHECPKCGFKW